MVLSLHLVIKILSDASDIPKTQEQTFLSFQMNYQQEKKKFTNKNKNDNSLETKKKEKCRNKNKAKHNRQRLEKRKNNNRSLSFIWKFLFTENHGLNILSFFCFVHEI